MCGRYFVNEEGMEEIEKVVWAVQNQMVRSQTKWDVYPTQEACILCGLESRIWAEQACWGVPAWQRKGVLINARSETAREKPLFREAVRTRRCVIPAAGFYEWDADRNQVAFTGKKREVLWMAGIYQESEEVKKFVILTRAANKDVWPIHERMPLLLKKEELDIWLLQKEAWEPMLHQDVIPLEKEGYVQESMFL